MKTSENSREIDLVLKTFRKPILSPNFYNINTGIKFHSLLIDNIPWKGKRNLKQIASELDVAVSAVSTVSKALRDSAEISRDIREKIKAFWNYTALCVSNNFFW